MVTGATWYPRAASIESVEGKAKIHQAQVLVGLDRYPEAIALLRRAQEIQPREDVARYIEQVERVSRQRRLIGGIERLRQEVIEEVARIAGP